MPFDIADCGVCSMRLSGSCVGGRSSVTFVAAAEEPVPEATFLLWFGGSRRQLCRQRIGRGGDGAGGGRRRRKSVEGLQDGCRRQRARCRRRSRPGNHRGRNRRLHGVDSPGLGHKVRVFYSGQRSEGSICYHDVDATTTVPPPRWLALSILQLS